MAMIIGSLVAREIGQLAVAQAPMIQEFATNAVVDIAKKSFDKVLDLNPNFSNFLGAFGIHRFSPKKTLSSRGKHRRITYHNHM
jgi:hypothetical protein